jgi:xyloglucan-specific endo-beta-1,4-glucanase
MGGLIQSHHHLGFHIHSLLNSLGDVGSQASGVGHAVVIYTGLVVDVTAFVCFLSLFRRASFHSFIALLVFNSRTLLSCKYIHFLHHITMQSLSLLAFGALAALVQVDARPQEFHGRPGENRGSGRHTSSISSVSAAVTTIASTDSESTSVTSTTATAVVAAASSTANVSATAEQATSTYCGSPNQYEILSNTPWIVYSMNYNYQSISGSCCTGYYSTSGSGDNQSIHWSSIWDIDATVNADVVKGYSFIGLTQNLETTLDSISSIPSTYTWGISNTTAYKGNVVYDFMTSDTKGDSTSTSAQELMLWLQYVGGQVPIGYADGPMATIDGLFGKDGWKLYQGKNDDTGITVSSLLVPEDDIFDGTFEGDIKEWLLAMSNQGIFSTSTYVNVGNAGMEPYWGAVTFDNNLSLRIDL